MMLASHELARIFFAGESDEARIVAADAFDDCACLGAASIAIGVFDGVHRGHHELIDAVVRDARNHGCKAVVVTFDPDPDVVVSPARSKTDDDDRPSSCPGSHRGRCGRGRSLHACGGGSRPCGLS